MRVVIYNTFQVKELCYHGEPPTVGYMWWLRVLCLYALLPTGLFMFSRFDWDVKVLVE